MDQKTIGEEVRKIIHIDMDAFFASVEQRDHPELRGKPVAVGNADKRGVVSAASYEARVYGVRSAMSSVKALKLCPDLIFVPPDFTTYNAVSRRVMDLFREYTDLIEPLSIDEAFLDVTVNKKGYPMAVDVAREIRSRIREELHLTASAGVAPTLFLAKIASEQRKPDGLFVIHPSQVQEFVDQLPIESFWGVGKVTAQRMHALGIYNGWQLRQYSLNSLTREFGKMGKIFYEFARGIDTRRVEVDSVRKSVGCEHTLDEDKTNRTALIIELYHVVTELLERLSKSRFHGNTLTLKIKYGDFTLRTRCITVGGAPLEEKQRILPLAKQLLQELYEEGRPVRLLGLSVSNPREEDDSSRPENTQLELEFRPW